MDAIFQSSPPRAAARPWDVSSILSNSNWAIIVFNINSQIHTFHESDKKTGVENWRRIFQDPTRTSEFNDEVSVAQRTNFTEILQKTGFCWLPRHSALCSRSWCSTSSSGSFSRGQWYQNYENFLQQRQGVCKVELVEQKNAHKTHASIKDRKKAATWKLSASESSCQIILKIKTNTNDIHSCR